MIRPVIRQFDVVEWPMQSARLIQGSINAVLFERGQCSVMLTGGRSAERLYTAWAGLPAFLQMTGVQFYFGDERFVPPDHPESNYGMAMRTLFNQGVPLGCSVFRMEADDPNHEAAALRYEVGLPDKVDVLLLGVGEDGHIASLFPGSVVLKEVHRRVVSVTGPKPPHERLTITPPVIAQARSVFVLATGAAKAQILVKALQKAGDFDTIPARLVLNATWLLDTPYFEAGNERFA
ncbi:MAG: 6-phosphogluconolactonase [Sideroxyarcus sp.]|nr:6-phosphogluconolactonase [Sideroxyarcus sp.]